MAEGKILYAGDASLASAASYLAGILTHVGLSFDYVPSNRPCTELLAHARHDLYILSDYPVNQWRGVELLRLHQYVEEGAGLLMIGGWESFCGAAGQYTNTPLADVLPVEMAQQDDRINCPQACLMELAEAGAAKHPILKGLPLDKPPGIGGYNRVKAKAGAATLLLARQFDVQVSGGDYEFTPTVADPLLVIGSFGRGRVAALATDVAPHWVGGLVDWGDARIKAQAEGGEAIEVGNWYAQFFAQLVRWTMGRE